MVAEGKIRHITQLGEEVNCRRSKLRISYRFGGRSGGWGVGGGRGLVSSQ
jgi:hypothetical protein